MWQNNDVKVRITQIILLLHFIIILSIKIPEMFFNDTSVGIQHVYKKCSAQLAEATRHSSLMWNIIPDFMANISKANKA